MNFRSLIIGAMLTSLFVIAMMNGHIFLSQENNVNASLLDEEDINRVYTQLNSSLNDAQESASNVRTAFEDEKPNLLAGFFLLESIINAAKALGSILVNIFNLTFGVMISKLGIPPLFFGVMTAILLIMMVFLAWKLFKQGE